MPNSACIGASTDNCSLRLATDRWITNQLSVRGRAKRPLITENLLMTRRKLDAYYSPASVASWLLENQQVGIEPTVGDGAIARPLEDKGYRVITNDIDPEVYADYHADIAHPVTWLESGTYDWIITNPPFNVLNEALRMSRSL